MWVFLISAVALWSPGLCYYNYQTALPNGQHVPHPCKPNYIWHGVGHLNPLGGGDRNPFGEDFARLGHKWSRELCQLDSDHDGLTNGQELGDPNCVWSQGQIPTRTDNITHPGICDPWNSHQCSARNTWVSCDVGQFKCDAINEPDVQNITVRFPRTKVPAEETTYTCFAFDIPADQPYHLVANTPYIDNPNVMHHIVLFGCDDTAELSSEPRECTMGYPGCTEQIGVWTVGMTGECLHPHTGFRIGQGAARRVALQFHWTNKHRVDHWYDSSGLTLYYTPRLRPYDAASFTIGQTYLEIPPARSSVTHTGSCTSACTRQHMTGPINVTTALSHMHYLGIHGRIELIRNGHVIKNLTNDAPYSYDSPHSWEYTEPVEVLPGDELKMVCEYASMNRDKTTFYGQGSFEEMCFGILTYYPASNFRKDDQCLEWKNLDLCAAFESGCDFAALFNISNPLTSSTITKVLSNCNQYGNCRAECPAAIAEARQNNPCLQGELWEYAKYIVYADYANITELFKLISAVDTCDRHCDQPAASSWNTPAATTPPPKAMSAGGMSMGGCSHEGGDSGMMSHGSEGGSASLGQGPMNAAQTFLQLARELGSRPLLQNIIMNVNQP